MHLDQPRRPARPPSGLRRITLPMLDTQKSADAFSGLAGLAPGQVLAAFKAAAPFLGFRIDIVFAIDWLFKFTQPQDWERGSRPIVWPSAAKQQAAFGLSASQVKYLNRQLAELGLIVMRDSPNGRRFGLRTHGKTGPIIEAYGFDLSPLATRMAEFQEIAAEGKGHQSRMKALRRRATIARNGLRQIFDTAATELAPGFDVALWQDRAALAKQGVGDMTDEGELTIAVARLELLKDEARAAFHERSGRSSRASAPVETDPKGLENQPPITATNKLPNPRDTVMAQGGGGSEHGGAIAQKSVTPWGQQRTVAAGTLLELGTVARPQMLRSDNAAPKLTPCELIQLAPKLGAYLAGPARTWTEIVDAADWLRSDLGISASLWGEACVALGRQNAAVAVAVVSAKSDGHFRVSPGAYFFGMVQRAKVGELNLARTIWGLRAEKASTFSTTRLPTLGNGCHG
jgi:replication initiation protein RepC